MNSERSPPGRKPSRQPAEFRLFDHLLVIATATKKH
jgi:hypothetical protein